MLRIRSLNPSDSLALLTQMLHCAYAELGAMGLNYTAVDQSPETTAHPLVGGHCFVAEWNGVMVGTLLAKPTEQTSECEYFTRKGVASLRQFGVNPAYRGKGIGKALVQACEVWARQKNFRELALDTAEPAIHLVRWYSSCGFSHVGFVQWSGKVYRSMVMSKVVE